MRQSVSSRSFSSSCSTAFESPAENFYSSFQQGRLSRSDSAFTSSSNVSKDEAFYILNRHAACNNKCSRKAMEQININHVESRFVYHLCFKTIKEIRHKAKVEKPYQGRQTVRKGHSQNYNKADIWKIPVYKTGNETSKQLEIPGTFRVQSCNNCGATGTTTCSDCSGAGMVWCADCIGQGHIQSIEGKIEIDQETSEIEDTRRKVLETCDGCNGQGNTICSCIRGRIECSRCAGRGKVETFDQLEITWKTATSDCFCGEKELPDNILNSFLPFCKVDSNLYRQTGKYVPPLSNKDCSVWELREASKAFSEKHTNWANCKGKQYQQEQTVRDIPLHKVWYDYKGKNSVFWIFGQDRKVYAPNYPRSKKLPGCTVM